MIRDLGYDESESNIIKAGLYRYTKDLHPDLGGKERAIKMKSYVKKKYINEIDINTLKQAIQAHKNAKPPRIPTPSDTDNFISDTNKYDSDIGSVNSDTSIFS